jgi:hypothetical protein
MLRIKLMIFVVLAVALAVPGATRAQAIVYSLEYIDNANNASLLDGTVRIVHTATPGLTGPSTICDPRGDQTPSPLYAPVRATHVQDSGATAEGELNSQFDYYRSPDEMAALMAKCKLTNDQLRAQPMPR